jgi:hypothetical protein
MSLFKELDKKNEESYSYSTALFWGALWGLSEATLGHILHMIRIPGLAGFVMLPLATFFMLKALQDSKKLSVIFSTSVVAATLKLSDLFLPGITALDIAKPAAAIVCESLAIIVLVSIIRNTLLQRHLI